MVVDPRVWRSLHFMVVALFSVGVFTHDAESWAHNFRRTRMTFEELDTTQRIAVLAAATLECDDDDMGLRDPLEWSCVHRGCMVLHDWQAAQLFGHCPYIKAAIENLKVD